MDPLSWLSLVVLILLSAYFSATETAFASLNKTRLKTMAENRVRGAELALSLSEKYDRLISTVLIGNNIVNIAASTISTILFVKLLNGDQNLGATVSTVVMTLLILIFGEISPKSIAKDCPEKFACFSAAIIRGLIFILTPINAIFSLCKKLLSKLFHIEENAKMSQEELLMLVEEVEQEGSIDTDEGELLRNAIEFTGLKAEDILTHRVDVEAVPMTAKKAEIAHAFFSTRFSRLPVYEESIDNIVGVVHLKDFFGENGITERPLKDIVTEPLFIQKAEPVDDLLKVLQASKSHLAVVVDEYGGTLGIITMEDILEELVGEIWDEHDEVVEPIVEIDERTVEIDCAVTFEDFCAYFELDAESDSVSVGGWVMEQLSGIPEQGDQFVFEHLEISVIEAETRRANRIRVVKKDSVPEADPIKA